MKQFFNAMRIARRFILDLVFDVVHDVHTRGDSGMNRASVKWPNAQYATRHVPTHPNSCHYVLEFVSTIINISGYAFIDYGSGKGRMLLCASEYRFSHVIGIEFVEAYHLQAQRNISSYRGKKRLCSHVLSINADVLEVEPPNCPLVIYLYNPFTAVVMRRVLDMLAVSFLKRPRDMVLIYVNPEYSHLLDEGWSLVATERFHKVYRKS